MHALVYTCTYMYAYNIYVDESEGNVLCLGVLYLMRKKIINSCNSTHTQ